MFSGFADVIGRFASPRQIGNLYRRSHPGLLNAIALEKFRKTVRYASEHSAFYREAFAKAGIDARAVRRPEDLGGFYTTPEDLAEHYEKFICQPAAIVFESSGTSGRNKRVFYGRRELDQMGKMMAAGLHLMGLRPEDRVANAFDFSIWIPGWMSHYGLMHFGTFCLAFGKVDPSEVYRRIDQYGFTVIMGEPTWLIRLTELAEKDGGRPMRSY